MNPLLLLLPNLIASGALALAAGLLLAVDRHKHGRFALHPVRILRRYAAAHAAPRRYAAAHAARPAPARRTVAVI